MDADEYKKKRAAREAAEKPVKEERDAKDREVLDGLEEKHGNAGVGAILVPCAPPLPGMVVIRPPEPSDFQLWQHTMTKAGVTATEKIEAHAELAASVIVYPEKDVYKQMVEKHAGIPSTVTAEAARMAGAGLVQRGKE
jgi:hypothetical protein